MKILTRTCYGASLQACQLLGLPFVLVPDTTLNEKFSVQQGVTPIPDVLPLVEYYCIGNGGHANQVGADGFPYTVPLQHLSTDAALYRHVPFVIRPIGNDLNSNARSAYALRKIITAPDNNQYIAYYLKRLDLTGVVTTMKLNSTVNGVTTVQPFVPTTSNLNPTPPPTSAQGVVTNNGDYITAAAEISINFSANDVIELLNVAQILYGNELYAVISEIGLCSGQDKLVTVTDPDSSTPSYTEAVAVQIMVHVTSYWAVGSSNQGIDIDIEVGATEPLYGATNVTTSLYTPLP